MIGPLHPQVSYTRYNTVAADVPWIIKKATGVSALEFVSETVIDYERREMTTRSESRVQQLFFLCLTLRFHGADCMISMPFLR